ncbi:hypothetical protein NQ318_021752 [Aromia moschata]|uniref:C2H2-type domain-containing protein n=1 Tax=Aromia moschata TaxID=1265417 RepID=A0AAV8XJ21_9CUCU|nr:hypothetical protein NQ318_021752 [Aromia moschata]
MPSEDTEMKFFVDTSYNSETNVMSIKSGVNQIASEIEMESPKGHKLIEDVAETRYCKLCPYVARRKIDLSKHVLIHQRSLKSRTYDCSFCSYKAKQKNNLVRHMLIHKDASETKHKSHLTRHMLIHKDSSEMTYQCALCSYKAKQKDYLRRHMWIHKDASEIKTFDCSFVPTSRNGKAI